MSIPIKMNGIAYVSIYINICLALCIWSKIKAFYGLLVGNLENQSLQ